MRNYPEMQIMYLNEERKKITFFLPAIHLSAHQHVRKLPVCRHSNGPFWHSGESSLITADGYNHLAVCGIQRRMWAGKSLRAIWERGSRRWATLPARYYNEAPTQSTSQPASQAGCILQLFITTVSRCGCRGQQRYALIPRIIHAYDYGAHNHSALYRKIIAGHDTDTHLWIFIQQCSILLCYTTVGPCSQTARMKRRTSSRFRCRLWKTNITNETHHGDFFFFCYYVYLIPPNKKKKHIIKCISCCYILHHKLLNWPTRLCGVIKQPKKTEIIQTEPVDTRR